jgi:hypothetical protein
MYKIIFFLAFLLILQSCNDESSIEVSDFSKMQQFEFNSKDSFLSGSDVVSAQLFVEGELEGKVRISATGTGGGDLTGKIDTVFKNDWYSKKASLYITPLGSAKGKLKLKFRFSKI